jgi:hypothetical protein
MSFCSSVLTYINFLAACASASNSALIVNVVIVSCLLARQPISPPKSFMANAHKLLRSVLLSAKDASLATIKLSWPPKRRNSKRVLYKYISARSAAL